MIIGLTVVLPVRVQSVLFKRTGVYIIDGSAAHSIKKR